MATFLYKKKKRTVKLHKVVTEPILDYASESLIPMA